MTDDLDLNTPCGHKYYYNVCIKCRHHQDDDLDLSPEAVERLIHDIARLKDSETHWLNEAERLRAERDAAWQAGAKAMREAAAFEAWERWNDADAECTPDYIADCIRALPLPSQPKENEA